MVTAFLLGIVTFQDATPPVSQTSKKSTSIHVVTETSAGFRVQQGAAFDDVTFSAKPDSSPKAVAFRKDKSFAVWDARGLTVRVGDKAISYRLGDLAVSPRLFERDEIRKNLELIAAGERTKDASALSGARRIGNEAFFLVRWEDKAKQPWLEALVKIDLAEAKPIWKLVGRFEGLSTAKKFIDDKMMLHNGSLAVVLRRGSDWGESFYSSKIHGFGFKKMGSKLVDFYPAGPSGAFVETTSYGTSVAGTVDFELGTRHESIEARGSISLIDGELPILAKATNGTLKNADSGCEFVLPKDSFVKRTKLGVLIWTPAKQPTSAVLYDPERWTPLARWAKNQPAPKSDMKTQKQEKPTEIDDRP